MSKYRNWSDERLSQAARQIQIELTRRTPPLPPKSYGSGDRLIIFSTLFVIVALLLANFFK